MNLSAHNIVSPYLIEAPKRFGRQGSGAIGDAGVLGVVTGTELLGGATQPDDILRGIYRALGVIGGTTGNSVICTKVGDPGFVIDDRPGGVEAPECNLSRPDVSQATVKTAWT